MNVISFDAITRSYSEPGSRRRVEALRGLTLQIRAGEIFAVAGLNGAGKTTAMKILLGLCRPDSGVIIRPGQPGPAGETVSVGFAPEEPDLPEYLKVTEVLHAACRLSGVRHSDALIDRAIQMLALEQEKDRLVEQLSKGTRQRVSLAAAIVHRPQLVILDEPASGLDPLGRQLVKRVIRQLNQEGATVFFTTHILSDLPGLCHRIGILHAGRLVFEGTPIEFCDSDSTVELEKRFAGLVGDSQAVPT